MADLTLCADAEQVDTSGPSIRGCRMNQTITIRVRTVVLAVALLAAAAWSLSEVQGQSRIQQFQAAAQAEAAGYWVFHHTPGGTGSAKQGYLVNVGTGEVRLLDGDKMKPVKPVDK